MYFKQKNYKKQNGKTKKVLLPNKDVLQTKKKVLVKLWIIGKTFLLNKIQEEPL